MLGYIYQTEGTRSPLEELRSVVGRRQHHYAPSNPAASS
jgi:hypothetical protein